MGSCNVDLIVRCRALPRPGETVLGDDVLRLPGGKGANQAVALARLGADVTMIGCVGDDGDGEWLREHFVRSGVRVDSLQRSARPTGTALIAVDDHGENEIIVAAGANAALSTSAVEFGAFDVVLAQLEVPLTAIDDVAARCSSMILNVAPAARVSESTLERCAVVIANEIEAQSLDVTSLAHCVVTLGGQGAVAYADGVEIARCMPPRVSPVDTVGAGDVFCAAYAFQIASGVDVADALRFAVTAGALATRAVGAQGALPTLEEVAQWIVRA